MNNNYSIALLGDSVFDNAAYTDGDPAVVDHLQRALGSTGRATLCAVDGSVTRQVAAQLDGLPRDTSHLAISSGGNDALQYIDLLTMNATSVGDALARFREPLEVFERDYEVLLERVAGAGIPAWCCTIYNGMMEEPLLAEAAPVAVGLFNDVIYRCAGAAGFPVIELRRVCTRREDFANPIEPSGVGGGRIAEAVLRACTWS